MMNVSVNSSRGAVGPGFAADPDGSAEDLAHEVVKAACQAVAEGIQGERDAFKRSADVNKRLGKAQGRVRDAERALARSGSQPPSERAPLEQELQSAQQELRDAESEAVVVEQYVCDWEAWRSSAEARLERVQNDANRLLRSLGKQEYPDLKPARDQFVRKDGLMREMARLLGRPKPLPPHKTAALDARRVSIASRASAANGAELLAQLLEENDAPAYRQTLAAESGEELTRMGAGLARYLGGGADEALAREGACRVLVGLSRASAVLGAGATLPLAEAFARGLGEVAPNGRLAQWLTLALRESSELTFAVELASALHAGGNAAASEEAVLAITSVLAEARAAFVRLAQQVEPLEAALVRQLPAVVPGRRAEELEMSLWSFDQEHAELLDAHAHAAFVLGTMLNGAALALTMAGAGGLPRTEPTARLVEESIFALGLADRVLQTERGQVLFGQVLDMQATGGRTFLDVVAEVTASLGGYQARQPQALVGAGLSPAHYADGGAGYLFGLQRAFAELLVPHLFALRGTGHLTEAVGLLCVSVSRNAGLFGLDAPTAEGFSRVFAAIAYARQPVELTRALGSLRRASVRPGTGAAVLKGLGMVMGLGKLVEGPSAQARLISHVLCAQAAGL
ncbi:MAG TPA: hypothetical protein VK420_08850, partial [Longimicrobium sp.]|nr:hypothetical protein [Longimicrobium sp.]